VFLVLLFLLLFYSYRSLLGKRWAFLLLFFFLLPLSFSLGLVGFILTQFWAEIGNFSYFLTLSQTNLDKWLSHVCGVAAIALHAHVCGIWKIWRDKEFLSLIIVKWNGTRHLIFWSLGTLTGLRDRVRRLVA
jgi:hypothetical protein